MNKLVALDYPVAGKGKRKLAFPKSEVAGGVTYYTFSFFDIQSIIDASYCQLS